jgi:hypothetical protein
MLSICWQRINLVLWRLTDFGGVGLYQGQSIEKVTKSDNTTRYKLFRMMEARLVGDQYSVRAESS